MKTIAIWNRYGSLFRDGRCFSTPEAPIGDGLLKPYAALKSAAALRDCHVDTLDRLWAQAAAGGVDGVIFFDYPSPGDAAVLPRLAEAKVPLYLVTWENELIVPENFDPRDHHFDKVFTWHSLWRGLRYVPIRYPQNLDAPWNARDIVPGPRSFACMVNSHKLAPRRADGTFDDRELYTARVDTLQWFAIRAPGKLDLYGPGWNGAEQWRGVIEPGKKRERMACYDFAFTYENAQGIPGYITEKVFDAMTAGCVPIYWGAPDVADYLPAGTFIDRRRFVSHEALFAELVRIRESGELAEYRGRIALFLADARLTKAWTVETFVDTLLREVLP